MLSGCLCLMLKSRKLLLARHVARLGYGRRAHKILSGKPERTRPRRSPKIRWEDNIIRDLKEIGHEGDWKTLVQDRVTWHPSGNEPSGSIMSLS